MAYWVGSMQSMRWWQVGLLGGVALSLATIVKLVRAIGWGRDAPDADLAEALGFAVAIFGMGFVCGVVALSRGRREACRDVLGLSGTRRSGC